MLATFGIGSIVGAMGSVFGQIDAPAAGVDPADLIDTVRSGSWQTFLALALTALAAALGGVVGAREDTPWRVATRLERSPGPALERDPEVCRAVSGRSADLLSGTCQSRARRRRPSRIPYTACGIA